jgi:hypothetical protein
MVSINTSWIYFLCHTSNVLQFQAGKGIRSAKDINNDGRLGLNQMMELKRTLNYDCEKSRLNCANWGIDDRNVLLDLKCRAGQRNSKVTCLYRSDEMAILRGISNRGRQSGTKLEENQKGAKLWDHMLVATLSLYPSMLSRAVCII